MKFYPQIKKLLVLKFPCKVCVCFTLHYFKTTFNAWHGRYRILVNRNEMKRYLKVLLFVIDSASESTM